MACEPPILLGDELTGNLDTQLTQDMFRLLKKLNVTGPMSLTSGSSRSCTSARTRKALSAWLVLPFVLRVSGVGH